MKRILEGDFVRSCKQEGQAREDDVHYRPKDSWEGFNGLVHRTVVSVPTRLRK